MSLKLEIPEAVSQALRLPPPEAESRLRLELSVSLYGQQILGLGKAAELAGLTRWEFNDVLARRGIPMHYSEPDLAHDIEYAHSSQ
jgi:predicted HTH domain antitoxin